VPILLGLCYESSRVYCRAYVSRRQNFFFRCITEQPLPDAAFPQEGPRQACLLGWKKSRTSLNLLRRVEVKMLYLASIFINPAGVGGTEEDRVP
jgi:hypothetical protein